MQDPDQTSPVFVLSLTTQSWSGCKSLARFANYLLLLIKLSCSQKVTIRVLLEELNRDAVNTVLVDILDAHFYNCTFERYFCNFFSSLVCISLEIIHISLSFADVVTSLESFYCFNYNFKVNRKKYVLCYLPNEILKMK